MCKGLHAEPAGAHNTGFVHSKCVEMEDSYEEFSEKLYCKAQQTSVLIDGSLCICIIDFLPFSLFSAGSTGRPWQDCKVIREKAFTKESKST